VPKKIPPNIRMLLADLDNIRCHAIAIQQKAKKDGKWNTRRSNIVQRYYAALELLKPYAGRNW